MVGVKSFELSASAVWELLSFYVQFKTVCFCLLIF